MTTDGTSTDGTMDINNADEAAVGSTFVRLLDVQPVERDYFQGIATPGGVGRMFGGQVIGQALMAATNTVEDDRFAHSLHAYFIRPGNSQRPVLYKVSRDRDGRSFATRRVVALQDGEVILNLSCSFQRAEDGMAHQARMPDVLPPEELASEAELVERYRDRLPEGFRRFISANRPVEIRPCKVQAPFVDDLREAEMSYWFRVRGTLPDRDALHRAALAFASDMGLLGVTMQPHGRSIADNDMQIASLDHALWIHAPVRADQWLLFATDSPWAGSARGLARGQMFDRSGRLVAEVAQEALIRERG